VTRVALVDPPWSFEGSVYFGCREPHLPLEYGYARALLEREGHEVLLVAGQLHGLSTRAIADEVAAFDPDLIAITTAPSYLFWRCAPPELRVPARTLDALRPTRATLVAVGPHASTTPSATLRKLGADVAVMGECEEVLAELARSPRSRWASIPSIAYPDGDKAIVQGGKASADLKALPALRWDAPTLRAHRHHHHRFDAAPDGPGAELEASRGCPYHCTFCAKNDFRDKFRKRPLETVLDELDGLLREGVRYVYFIDEIFVPDRALLEALAERDVSFGVQMRIDNWSKEMLDLLGRAACVSIEAGVESITPEGRSLLQKKCKMSTGELTELLVHAKRRVPFVQANLLGGTDDAGDVAAWRKHLLDHGVWSNDPVPLFPYPGSPDYVIRFGAPDAVAWERAHEAYLASFDTMSEIQDARPVPLPELEAQP
jgi:B12-binding domain/radical SAM domain protein of rhizo-twelve system